VVSFFKEKSTSAVFGLVIVSTVIRAFFWQHPAIIDIHTSDGLMYYVLQPLQSLPAGVVPFVYNIIIIIQALRLNYALNDVRMFNRQSFTSALAYVVLTALLPAWNNITAALLINSMIIWLLYRLIKLYTTQQPKTLLFNIGLITGSTVLLYFPSCVLVLVVIFAVAIFRPFRLNEWLIVIFGVLTPLYFLAAGLFLSNNLHLLVQQSAIFTLNIIRPANLAGTIATFSISGFIIAAGVYLWQKNSNRMIIQVRKNWSVLFILFLLLSVQVFFIQNAWPNALMLATVPAAAFVGNTFIAPKRNLWSALIFWLLVLLVVYNNWLSILN
jgi:hypothetical protein